MPDSIMKKILTFAILFLSALSNANAQDSTPFPYPEIPDSLTTLQQRTDYLIMNFWKGADMKKVLNDTTMLNKAFADYTSFMPYASPDSVKKSINTLLAPYKNDAKSILKLVRRAEKEMYGPDPSIIANEPYLIFTKAVFTNKKINQKEKEKYLSHVKMINSSQVGASILPLRYTTRYNAVHEAQEQPGEYKILYFYLPDDPDVAMNHLRLKADAALGSLSKAGTVKIIDIMVGKPSDEWKASVSDFPYEWEAGVAENAGETIDLRMLPAIYLLDKDNKVIARNMSLDSILQIAKALYQK